MTITLRSTKGSELTWVELDANFTDLAARIPGGPSATTWSTTWDMAGFKDMGDFTVTGALAIVSSDTGSVRGGSTQAVLVANGTNVPTFDGAAIPDYINTAGARNLVQLYRGGLSKFWSVGSRTGVSVVGAT